MKKVLLFMLLFIAGISVLRWIQNPVAIDTVQAGDEQTQAEPSAPTPEPEPITEASSVPVAPEQSEGGDIAVKFSGAAEFTKRVLEGPHRGRKVFRLQSKDSRTLSNGQLELIDLWAVAYDTETDEELLRVKAKTGLAEIVDTLDHDIVLSGVELTLLRNAPVVPLVMRTENLLCSPQDNQFRTKDRVEIEGQGLRAAGVGFEFEVAAGLFRFDRDGYAAVEIENEHTSTLTCAGPLTIRRTGGPKSPLALDALENALLSITGEKPILLSSDRLRIVGRTESKDGDLLGFERIDADGSVTLSMSGNHFSSERAKVELLPDGKEFRAEMSGTPHGNFSFRGGLEPTDVPDEADAAIPFAIEFSGQGPLVVNRAEGTEFELMGPAQLEWSGAVLDATRVINGTFGPEVDEADFAAFGDVQIRREGRLLNTPEFRLRHERDSEHISRVSASASGPARMAGDVDAEHSFLLTSDNQIDFAVEGEEWRVPRANGISLTVEGPRGFVAKAREVVGFAPEPLTLEAIGEISLESVWGNVQGERLKLQGLENMKIDGLPGQLAHFASERGEWFALHVERSATRMIAVGVDRAIFSDEYGRYELGCDQMIVEEIDEPAEAGGGLRDKGFRFRANGSVVGEAIYPGDTFHIESDQLRGEWIEHLREDAFLYSESILVAQGNVHTKFSRASNQFELRSDLFTATRTNRGSELLTSDALVAEGNVEVESVSDARIHGRGDRLEIDKFGRGVLIASEGNRIQANGVMARGKLPYAMTAARLRFSDTELDAAYPEIEFLTIEPSLRHPDGVNTRASARRLVAREDDYTLTGDVRLEGIVQNQGAFILLADEAHIDVRRPGTDGLLASVDATGQIEFDLENVMHARGDKFLAKSAQQRFRVSGSPATVYYRDMTIQTTWIEYDHLIKTIETGDAIISPETSTAQAAKKQK